VELQIDYTKLITLPDYRRIALRGWVYERIAMPRSESYFEVLVSLPLSF